MHSVPRMLRMLMISLGLIAGAILMVGCESTDLTADPEGQLVLTASPSTVSIDDSMGEAEGQTSIVAQVFDPDGFAAEDVAITFTTTAGSLDSADEQGVPTVRKTDSRGVALDVLTVGVADPSPITVTARSGTVSESVTVEKVLTSGSLLLTANPTQLQIDVFASTNCRNEGTVALEAEVLRSDGSPWDGAMVTFSTTFGILDSNSNSIVTGADGTASDTLRLDGRGTGAVEVTARSGNLTDSVFISQVGEGQIVLTQENTRDGVVLTATLTRLGGGAAVQGINVGFSIDPELTSPNGLRERNVLTDSSGVASNLLTIPVGDMVTVTASACAMQDTIDVTGATAGGT